MSLRVPRGVHFFLREDQLIGDVPTVIAIASCTYCGHLQSLDEPVLYDEQPSSASYVSASLLEDRKRQAARTFTYAAQKPRKALEIGCGDGHFLTHVATLVDVVYGVEPSRENARLARARGLAVDQTLITEATKLDLAPFDAFFSFHVLEHVPDVKAFLRGIRNNLTEGAVGCIEVPSTEAAYETARFGHFMADHLSYFFASTLRLALESSGFEIIGVDREAAGEVLVAYVRARRAALETPIPQWIAATMNKFLAFVNAAKLEGRSVALWGASNLVLPVLMHLPKEVPMLVVDGAPTKQGLHAPGSHVRVLAPEVLRERKVDYLVITAPRFAEEIERELHERFHTTVETFAQDVGVADRVSRLVWNKVPA